MHREWTRERALVSVLAALTVLSGVVDAVSFLGLGHVFVANMTGNVVFLGFAVAGSPDVTVSASLTALAFFLVGALVGGRLRGWRGDHAAWHLVFSTWVGSGLVAAATALAWAEPGQVGPTTDTFARHVVTALLALTFGLQNATVRHLRVPDMTTSVLTMTLTGLAADSTLAGGTNANWGRRLVSVACMAGGALAGGVLVLHADVGWGLVLALGLMVAIAVVLTVLAVRTSEAFWRP